MKTIKENVFVVREIRDSGHEPVIGYFKNPDAARSAQELVGGYGGKTSQELLEYKIYDSFDEYMADKAISLKKSALGKLTKEERYALGL